MTPKHDATEARLFKRWLRSTALGWLLGLGVVVALAAVWGLFGGNGQFMIGVGMGGGVGYLQSRILKDWMSPSWLWWFASTAGMGVLFVAHDLFALADIQVPYSLPLYVVAGGFLSGLPQCFLLGAHSRLAGWWVLASTIGWALPATAIAVGDAEGLKPWGQLLSLIGIFGGGLLLGSVSGMAMLRILGKARLGEVR